MDGGYPAMRELKESGAVRAIGLGVNECEVCEQALDVAEFDCMLLAGRYTLLDQSALASLLPRCERQGVSIILGGPFNSGILARGTRGANSAHYDYAAVSPEIKERVARLESVCERHAVPLTAAALQFPMAHPCVASVIPGMSTAAEVDECLSMFNLPIPAEFWRELAFEGLVQQATPLPGTACAA
jgi:D-threo-aldose 1-dehydrogenase